MDDELSFGFELVDEASNPAGRIHRSFNLLERDLKELNRASGLHLASVGDDASAAGVKVGTLGTIFGNLSSQGITAMAGLSVEAARFAAESAVAFGSAAVGAVAFREKSEAALSALSHGGDGAEQFERIKDIALEFGTPLDETVKGFQKLAAMQFSEGEAETFFKRMQDLRSVGADAEEAKRALVAITQIKSAGKLQGDELNQLAEAGVSVELVMQELADATGKTVAEVFKLKEAGKIDADLALGAIERAIGKKTGAVVAGDAGKAFAQTMIEGMGDRIRNLGPVLLDDVGQALAPALDGLKPLLNDAFEGLRSDEFKEFLGAAGEAVGTVAEGLIELKPIASDVFAGLTGSEAQATMKGVAEGVGFVLDGVKAAWPIVKEFSSGFSDGFGEAAEVLKEVGGGLVDAFGGGGGDMKVMAVAAGELGHGLGMLVVEMAAVGAAVGGLLAIGTTVVTFFTTLDDRIATFTIDMGRAGSAIGSQFISGLTGGLLGGQPAADSAAASVGASLLGSLKGVLGIASPSKETRWIGDMAGQGLPLGVGDQEGATLAAMYGLGDSMAGALPKSIDAPGINMPDMPRSPAGPKPMRPEPLAPSRPRAGAVGGNKSLSVSVSNSVTGGKEARETGKQVAEQTLDGIVDELERFLSE